MNFPLHTNPAAQWHSDPAAANFRLQERKRPPMSGTCPWWWGRRPAGLTVVKAIFLDRFPQPPMGWTDVDMATGLHVRPSSRRPSTRENERVHLPPLEDSELKIPVEWGVGNRLPRAGMWVGSMHHDHNEALSTPWCIDPSQFAKLGRNTMGARCTA